MDSLPSYEFHGIVRRVTTYVDLQGKTTVLSINKEIWKAQEQCRKHALQAKNKYERAKFKRAAIGYANLIRYHFANRLIKEAIADPSGYIATILIYGRLEAERRINAQRRSRMRFYRRPNYRR